MSIAKERSENSGGFRNSGGFCGVTHMGGLASIEDRQPGGEDAESGQRENGRRRWRESGRKRLRGREAVPEAERGAGRRYARIAQERWSWADSLGYLETPRSTASIRSRRVMAGALDTRLPHPC